MSSTTIQRMFGFSAGAAPRRSTPRVNRYLVMFIQPVRSGEVSSRTLGSIVQGGFTALRIHEETVVDAVAVRRLCDADDLEDGLLLVAQGGGCPRTHGNLEPQGARVHDPDLEPRTRAGPGRPVDPGDPRRRSRPGTDRVGRDGHLYGSGRKRPTQGPGP